MRFRSTIGLIACAALFGCGKADPKDKVPALLAQLTNGSSEQKVAAAGELAALGEAAAAAIPQLIEAMKGGQSLFDPVEMAASKALAKMGRPAALSLLDEIGKRPSRASIERTLGELSLTVLPELSAMSRDPDERKRRTAVELLRHAGPDGALPIGESLRDVSDDVRRAGANALKAMGSDAGGALQELIAAVERRDTPIIGEVVATLGRLGAVAKDALPALQSLAAGESMPEGKRLSAGLRAEIEKAIRKIQGEIRTP